MITRLGDLLRLALENTQQQEVSLEQEIAILKRYLEIEQMRFGDRLRLNLEIDPVTLGAAVPNLILQPLVENAIRHAIELRESAGEIALRCARNQDSLVLQVSDNGPDAPVAEASPADAGAVRRERVGLANTRERLRKLYGEDQRLELTGNAMGGFTARLTIPFRQIPSPMPAA
jgi:sensor histidine kinase YesM